MKSSVDYLNSEETSLFKKDFDVFLQNVIDMFDDDYYFKNKEIILSDSFTKGCKDLFYRGATEKEVFRVLKKRIEEKSIVL